MDKNSQLVDAYRPINVVDPIKIPLSGWSLIEASAGTGKTYVLSLIYLRLLLGMDNGASLRPLTVDEILVVTFTNLATEELRYRIRENIRQLRIACLRGYHSETIYNEIITQISDRNEAAAILLLAEQKMDNAAIYTIHSFCQRVLTTHAVESGVLFEYDFSLTMDDLYDRVFQDFWRRFFNPLPIAIAKQIKKEWDGPKRLAETFKPGLSQADWHPSPLIEPMSEQLILSVYNQAIDEINQTKEAWRNYRNNIETIIQSSGINKRSYNKKNLNNWLLAVDQWVAVTTDNFTIPDSLRQFCYSTLVQKSDQNPPDHPLFHLINRLCDKKITLNALLSKSILNELVRALRAEKEKQAKIEPDDLLTFLKQALVSQHGSVLAAKLAHRYPVAMIDEFQDTDAVQYSIFSCIYKNRDQTGLILVGDPKQAIYQFRGADISVYLKAKDSVDYHFVMDVNWRSSADMVAAVNQLFINHNNPFIFEKIPFIPVKSAEVNRYKSIELWGGKLPAVQYYLLPETMTTVEYCRYESAKQATQQICCFINAGSSQQGFLVDGVVKKVIVPSDIVVLVRDRSEASVMSTVLTEAGIQNVFLSNRLSVFESIQAKELFWLLQAVLTPQNSAYIYTALATQLFSFTLSELDNLQGNASLMEEIIDEFNHYRHYWDKFGVLALLRYVIKKRAIAQTILAMKDGERMLTNFVHVSELLQKMADQFDSKEALLRWFAKKIVEPDSSEEEQQRLESDQDRVTIVTIHKSKGLEYPIVILPFIGFYKKQIDTTYHQGNFYNKEMVASGHQDRLAEDLRLCYVALTRSIYYCLLGIATVNKHHSAFHKSAFGYLIQQGQAGDYLFLQNCLMKLPLLVQQDIDTLTKIAPVAYRKQNRIAVSVNQFQRQFELEWSISSYSSLCIGNRSEAQLTLTKELFSGVDTESYLDESERQEEVVEGEEDVVIHSDAISIHCLSKGKNVGVLIHRLLEEQDFAAADRTSCFNEFKRILHLTDDWDQTLTNWLSDILTTPLDRKDLILSCIDNDQKLVEFAFYFPIRKTLSAARLNAIRQQYHTLSVEYQPLSFKTVTGMLKGFIDLVFKWRGRFYIVDYKSNWLGADDNAYSQSVLEQAMVVHHYDLQYQLYTLALHRYLKQRLIDYDYGKHIGGIYYIFLRGVKKSIPGNGIFHTKVNRQFIEALDQLF